MKPALKLTLAAVAALSVVVTLFVAPAHDPRPRGLPVAVTGPPQAAEEVRRRAGDAIEVVPVRDAAAAREAVLEREAYGALVPAEGRLLVATAASPVVAQVLQGAFADATVEELRPLDPGDPRGVTLNLLMLPLIAVSLGMGALLAREALSGPALAGAALGFAALAGPAVIAVVALVTGALPGSFLALSGAAALLVAAVALLTAGLARRFGLPGVPISALVVLLIGNPASGAASAPELLPGFWREVGPLLPPGAGATALRNVAYFDGAATAGPLLVLAAFAAAGGALVLLGRAPSR